MRVRGLLLACALLPCFSGCATVPRDPDALAAFKANNDPLEPMNRKTFAFNQGLDRALLKPLAKGYQKLIPAHGRDGIRNFIANLHEPVVLVNNLLQGEFRRAATTGGRFVANTTLGLAGVMDFAGRHGLARQSGDFGQTLYVWGVHEGVYLVLPVIGPSSPRDAVGLSADLLLNPLFYVAPDFRYKTSFSVSQTVVGGIDERARNLDTLDEIQREAVDFYASIRSLYRQDRAAELRHGTPPTAPRDQDLYRDPGSNPGSDPGSDPGSEPAAPPPSP